MSGQTQNVPWTVIASGLALAVVLGACGDPYPAQLMASTRPPTVRVLLHTAPRERVALSAQPWSLVGETDGSYSVRDSRTRVLAFSAGASGIDVDRRPTRQQTLRLSPRRTFSIGKKTYGGVLIIRQKGKRLELVNELDMETYVAGVIGNEVGPGAESATHRAQAVAARTYAYRRLLEPGAASKPYHLFDDQRSQVYNGMTIDPVFGVSFEEMRAAVRANRGVTLTYLGRPFRAYYSSTCGGHTTDPKTSRLDPGHAHVPLRGVPCEHCRPSNRYASKYYRWNNVVTDERIAAGMKRDGRPISLPVHSVKIASRGRGGWVAEVEIIYGPNRATKRVPGSTFRSIAGLRSHNIATIVRAAGDAWRFDGKGWGHGVGMCQVGAIQMGLKGATETEILRYYFPDVSFTKVY